MAIVKLYLHVCKQAAACQGRAVTALQPLPSGTKPCVGQPFLGSAGNVGWGWPRCTWAPREEMHFFPLVSFFSPFLHGRMEEKIREETLWGPSL